MTVAAGLAAYAALVGQGPLQPLAAALGVVGACGVGAGIVLGHPRVVGWAVTPLLGAYGVALVGQPQVDPFAPAYAGGLVATVELAATAVEPGVRVSVRRGRGGRGGPVLVGTVLAGTAAAAVVHAVVALPLTHGALVQAAGVGAAAGLLTLVGLLLRPP